MNILRRWLLPFVVGLALLGPAHRAESATTTMMSDDLLAILASSVGVQAPKLDANVRVLIVADDDVALPPGTWGRYCDGQMDEREYPGCEGREYSILVPYRTLTVNPRWGIHVVAHEVAHGIFGHDEQLAEAYACAKFPGRIIVITHGVMCTPSGDAYYLSDPPVLIPFFDTGRGTPIQETRP